MEFLILASAHFLAVLSPGPDFFLIVQATLRLKLRYSIAICAGIAGANATYLIFALLGIEIIKNNAFLLQGLQHCGAVYLVFIGYHLLKSKKTSDGKIQKTTIFF